MAESRFHEWFEEAATSLGWIRVNNLDVALAAWQEFIEQCSDGYAFGIDEYNNDISVRDALEIVFSKEASAIPGGDHVRVRVNELDVKFRSLLQPDVKLGIDKNRWWRTGVLKSGGPELVVDMAEEYGIDIALASNLGQLE